jgi:hypothetical protein
MVRVLALIALLIMASASQAFTIAPRATSFTTVSTSSTVFTPAFQRRPRCYDDVVGRQKI